MKNFLTKGLLVTCLVFVAISCDNSEDISTDMALENDVAFKRANSQQKGSATECATIQDGTILDANGQVITTGFNEDGYNYQARTHQGPYEGHPILNYVFETWNDAYLSNKDCDRNNRLDFANGQPNYRGTGAWLKNKYSGSHLDSEGKVCNVVQVIKYVAVPVDAISVPGGPDNRNVFLDGDGNEIGIDLKYPGFEDFALIQLIWNDPCKGLSGKYFNFPPPKLGNR